MKPQRHQHQIIAQLQRISKLRRAYRQASPEDRLALREQITQASERLGHLQRDTPIMDGGGRIRAQRVNGE